jgi:nucleoside 2-deoxyribosyltransferase
MAASSERSGIYFAGSIRGGRDDAALYCSIIDTLRTKGHTVWTEHVGAKSIDAMGETEMSESAIYERDMAWLRSAACVVAECTVPSLGVGYELGQAEAMGIPCLVLFRPSKGRSLSAMLRGNKKAFAVHEYGEADDALFAAIDAFIASSGE